MKKIICVVGIVMLCASMVFAFTKKDLAGLKGTWEGTATSAAGVSVNVKLEIMNDAEPVQGKLTFTKIPDKIKTDYGVQDPATGDSNDGKITSTGTIMFTGANAIFEIISVKDKKLSGWGYFRGFKANISATKK